MGRILGNPAHSAKSLLHSTYSILLTGEWNARPHFSVVVCDMRAVKTTPPYRLVCRLSDGEWDKNKAQGINMRTRQPESAS